MAPQTDNYHVLKFYRDEPELYRTLVEFTAGHAETDGAMHLVVTPDHWEELRDELTHHPIAVDRLLDCGQLVYEDAEALLERLPSNDRPTDEQFASVIANPTRQQLDDWPHVTFFSEVFDLFAREGRLEAMKKWERMMDDLCDEEIRANCAYRIGRFGESKRRESFRALCDSHQKVVPAGDDPDGEDVADLQRTSMALSSEIEGHEQLEARLQESIAYEQKVNRRKDEFLAMLAHELRNPIAAILNAVELMRLRGDSSIERERNIIERQMQHMTRLVDDLLDVSRVTRGNIELERRPLEVTAFIEQAVETARPSIEEKNHELHVSLPDEPPIVDGDLDRLAQVVSNLLTNAAQYTDEGGNIWLEAEPVDDSILVRVRDDGRGFEPESRSEIFGLFYRGEGAVSPDEGTLGVGLALARQIVELHDGTIDAYSEGPGRGSEFVVRLPTTEVELDEPDESTPTTRESSTRSVRVLLVDDNRDLADTFAETLELLGHEVRVAYDARSALELFDEFAPELALVDINLPDLSGYQLAERFEQRRDDVQPLQLVALTGYGDEARRRRSQEVGFDAHLVKPIGAEQLRQTLAAVHEE